MSGFGGGAWDGRGDEFLGARALAWSRIHLRKTKQAVLKVTE
jgi:hypothetical protein